MVKFSWWPFSSFYIKLLTDRQTNTGHYITSLADVISPVANDEIHIQQRIHEYVDVKYSSANISSISPISALELSHVIMVSRLHWLPVNWYFRPDASTWALHWKHLSIFLMAVFYGHKWRASSVVIATRTWSITWQQLCCGCGSQLVKLRLSDVEFEHSRRISVYMLIGQWRQERAWQVYD